MIYIVSDTTASLPAALAEQQHISVVPQIINIGGESYREGIDLDTQTFIDKLRSSRTLPKTAAPPPQLFTDLFQRLTADNCPIICLHPSSEVSGTVRSAQLAAVNFPDADIRIIDTRTIAFALGMIVLRAAEGARSGQNAEMIIAQVQSMMAASRTYFRVATLEYLARGGRIGGAAALLGSILQVKPILTLHDGRIEQFARERTERSAIQKLTETIVAECPRGEGGTPAMMYDGSIDQLEAVEQLARHFGNSLGCGALPLYTLPPAILTHAGPGVIGVGFFAAANTN